MTATTADGSREIRVTGHAIKQASERFGWRGSRGEITRMIVADVVQGLAAGRRATRLPGEFNLRSSGRARRYGAKIATRYTWTDDLSRGYVLRKADGRWNVVTCVAAWRRP